MLSSWQLEIGSFTSCECKVRNEKCKMKNVSTNKRAEWDPVSHPNLHFHFSFLTLHFRSIANPALST
jgi:hypothetical protein